MAPATLYSHGYFWREFECIPEKEFEFNGCMAFWAPNEIGPRFWDAGDQYIDVPTENPLAGNVPHSALALIWDERFLAVAINTNVRIYDVENLRLCAELAPHPHNVYSLDFRPRMSCVGEGMGIEYLLVSSTTWHRDEKERGGGPEVIVFDAVNLREECRLLRHEYFTISASWSPDSALIATASWNGTYGICVALSGVRRHSIPTFDQNWYCSFLRAGGRILVSGGPPDSKKNNNINRIAIDSFDNAKPVISLKSEDLYLKPPLPHLFAVHPNRELIIVPTIRQLLAWTPFEMATDEVTSEESSVQILLTLGAVESSKANRFTEISVIKLIDGGCKLLVQVED